VLKGSVTISRTFEGAELFRGIIYIMRCPVYQESKLNKGIIYAIMKPGYPRWRIPIWKQMARNISGFLALLLPRHSHEINYGLTFQLVNSLAAVGKVCLEVDIPL